MNSSQNKNVWDQIDLNHHAIIEASAGTGKTYTVLQFVLRLLIHEKKNLEDLLLVTFTEKATGELKDRIREGLTHALQKAQNPETQARLEANLARVDQAPISTIHGFCLSTLQSQAFEAGLPIQTQIIDDREGLQKCWRSLLRKDWIQTLSAEIGLENAQELIQLAMSQGNPQEDVLLYAQEWLDPQIQAGENLSDLWQEYQQNLAQSQESARQNQLNKERVAQIYPQMQKLGAALYSEISHLDKPAKMLELKALCSKLLSSMDAFEVLGRYSANKIASFLGEASAKKMQLQDRYTELAQLWSELHASKPQSLDFDQKTVVKCAFSTLARAVVQMWQAQKQAQGWISYDDMIRLLAERLQSGDEKLLQNLRQKYQYGIVDEFQDTDQAQWSIFRKIFLEAQDHHRLLVVGDPKQAIYGFRGADLETYFHALQEMEDSYGAQRYHLMHNFRSSQAMIQSYNLLLHGGLSSDKQKDQVQWFRHPLIRYAQDFEVAYGAKDHIQQPFWGDSLGQSYLNQRPIQVLDLSQIQGAAQKYQKYAQWVVHQILAMLDPQNPLKIPDEHCPDGIRPLCLNDIAILSRSKGGPLKAIQNALDQALIPWDQYKQDGIFQSPECLHWILLLEALLNGGGQKGLLRKLALTPFYGLSLEELENQSEDELQSAFDLIRSQLRQWMELADRREWARLVRHINQHSRFYAHHLDQSHGDRSLSNLTQIQNQTLEWMAAEQMSLQDIVLRLRQYRQVKSLASEEEGLLQLANSQAKVQILTMHTSKGLEYPVVFNVLATNASNDLNKCWKYVDAHGKLRLFLSKSSSLSQIEDGQIVSKSIEERRKLELEQEHARLLYVSLTRASCLQFVPYHVENQKFDHFAHIREFAQGQNCLQKPQDWELIPYHLNHLTVSVDRDTQSQLQNRLHSIGRHSQVKQQFSFTKLSPHEDRDKHKVEEIKHDEIFDPKEIDKLEEKTALPPGKFTGLFWHGLFEDLDWEILNSGRYSPEDLCQVRPKEMQLPRELDEFIRTLDRHQSIQGLWHRDEETNLKRRRESIEILQRTLSTAIPDPFFLPEECRGLACSQVHLPQQGLVLAQIPSTDRQAELDFLCPVDAQGQAFPLRQIEVRSWLTGSLDLVFRHQGRYYILDWKSNKLPDYQPHTVHQAIRSKHYDLQAAIYSMALDRWLRDVQPHYDPEQHFGGVIYAFVRGVGANGAGLWIRRPSAQDWSSHFQESLGAGRHLQELICKNFKESAE